MIFGLDPSIITAIAGGMAALLTAIGSVVVNSRVSRASVKKTEAEIRDIRKKAEFSFSKIGIATQKIFDSFSQRTIPSNDDYASSLQSAIEYLYNQLSVLRSEYFLNVSELQAHVANLTFEIRTVRHELRAAQQEMKVKS